MSFIVERQTGLPSGETPRKYPFPTLKVGDSIKVTGEQEFRRARMAAYQFARRNKVAFYTAPTKSKGGTITGGRITRTK